MLMWCETQGDTLCLLGRTGRLCTVLGKATRAAPFEDGGSNSGPAFGQPPPVPTANQGVFGSTSRSGAAAPNAFAIAQIVVAAHSPAEYPMEGS
jgi:hypothetical protein